MITAHIYSLTSYQELFQVRRSKRSHFVAFTVTLFFFFFFPWHIWAKRNIHHIHLLSRWWTNGLMLMMMLPSSQQLDTYLCPDSLRAIWKQWHTFVSFLNNVISYNGMCVPVWCCTASQMWGFDWTLPLSCRLHIGFGVVLPPHSVNWEPSLWRYTIIKRNAVWASVETVNHFKLAAHALTGVRYFPWRFPWKFEISQPCGPLSPLAYQAEITDLRPLNVFTHLIFTVALWLTVSVTAPCFGDEDFWRWISLPRLRNMPKVTWVVELKYEPKYFGSKALTLHKRTGQGSGNTAQDLLGPGQANCPLQASVPFFW